MKIKTRFVLNALLSLSIVSTAWPASAVVAARAALPRTPAVVRAPVLRGASASLVTGRAPLLPLAPAEQLAPAPEGGPASAASVNAPVEAPRSADAPAFLSDESVRGKTVVLVGTKGSRPFILEEVARVAKELGLTLILIDDPENRKNSATHVPDSHFIAASLSNQTSDTMREIEEQVARHPVASKADVVASFLRSNAKLAGQITNRLGASGIASDAVSAADFKPEARRRLNEDPVLRLPFAQPASADEARQAYRAVSENGRRKVMLKTSRGENSRFLAFNIDSEDAAAAAFEQLDAEARAFAKRPEAQGTLFSQYSGLMMEQMIERLPDTPEVSLEIIMQKGRAVFSIISDTLGLGPQGELAGGALVFPSRQSAGAQQAMVTAAERALRALGIVDGNARVDVMMTAEGPRLVEVNPSMGGAAIWTTVRSLTGVSLVEQGLRALLGLKVDPGRAPTEVAHHVFLASEQTGTVEAVEGIERARAASGVVEAKSYVSPGDTVQAASRNSYEEWGEVIGKGKDWPEAITAAVEGARLMELQVLRADGARARQSGDHLQPRAEHLVAPALPQAPKLLSRLILGFFSAFILVQTVVESTALAISQMTQPLSQGFMALGLLTFSSYAALASGSFLGGRWVDRFGIDRSYRAVLVARFVVWSVIVALFNPATGTVPLMFMIPLVSLDYFLHAIGRVAEHKLQAAWFHDSPVRSNNFGAFRDFVEYATVIAASLLAVAVTAYGFGVVIYPAPIVFAAAALVTFALALPRVSPKRTVAIDWGTGFKTLFRNARIVRPMLGYILANSFIYVVYYMIATAFGNFVTGDPQQAAAVAGSLTGFYGIGALIGAAVMLLGIGPWIERKTQKLPEPQREDANRRLYARSAALSMVLTGVGLLGSWLFVSPTILFTSIVGWPVFWVSPAMLVIGIVSQMTLTHLDTIMKDRIPPGDANLAGSILGAIRTLSYLSYMIGFLVWGTLFAWLGAQAFALFAAFYTVTAIVYLWLARTLKRGQ